MVAAAIPHRLTQESARLRHASTKTTLDTYGYIWPDRDESTAPLWMPSSPPGRNSD